MPGPHKAGEVAAQLSPVVADDDAHIPSGDTQSDLCLPQVRLVWDRWRADRISNAHIAIHGHLAGSVAICQLEAHFGGTARVQAVETAQLWKWLAPTTVLPLLQQGIHQSTLASYRSLSFKAASCAMTTRCQGVHARLNFELVAGCRALPLPFHICAWCADASGICRHSPPAARLTRTTSHYTALAICAEYSGA